MTKLSEMDKHLVALLSQTLDLAKQIEEYKRAHSQSLLPFELENKRLAEIRKFAEIKGLNSDFVSSLAYSIIREACAIEFKQFQNKRRFELESRDER